MSSVTSSPVCVNTGCRAAPQLMISGNSRCMRYSELMERWKERERAAAEAELLSEQFEK
jgi:hypothetical protein